MEDDEETFNVDESSNHGVEDSITENNRSEIEKLTNTEQCELVTELVDSQLVGVESPSLVKDEEAVVVAEIPSAVTEPEAAEGSEQKFDSMVEEAQKSPIVAIDEKGEEEVADEENPIGGTEMEMVVVGGSEEKAFEELDDAEPVRGGADSVTVDELDRDEQVAEEENLITDTEMETGRGMVVVNGGGGESVPESDDAQPVGSDVAKVEFDDGAMAEVENKTEMVGGESDGGKSVPDLDDAQPVGGESVIAAEVEFDDDAMADTEMEREIVEGDSGGGKFDDELDNTTLLGADSPVVAKDDDDEEEVGEDGNETPMADNEMEVGEDGNETPMADNEMEVETDIAEMVETDMAESPEGEKETGSGGGGKRKRGRNAKVTVKASSRKTIGDDVCFVCFDGGDLVLCDRRACPKAYHPSCVNRDEAFFRAKGRWNCGWHICSNCEKNAYYMCYTCTFSLCKGCIKDAVILCIRGNKGFCETCMKVVMLIENNEQGNKEVQVDFDDKSSWEYLFKDYWIDLKAKLSVTSDELAQAKNPWKGSDVLARKQELPEELYDANNDVGSGSDSSEHLEASKKTKKRKGKKKLKSRNKEEDVPYTAVTIDAEGTALNTEWASKELLEFVMHMKDGDKSVLSQFDVQALLLEYIKINKLRDPRRKSQIVCDSRLENLFGKPRVGHFEMLKLLESHFLIKEDSQIDDVQGTVVDTEVNQLEADGNADVPLKGVKDRRRRTRKKGADRGPQSNLDDYAAIDIYNISLIYLRRKLMEDLIEDTENFHDKVVGTFVRIRISGSNQKQDLYRLVQVVGTTKAAEPYKIVKRTTDIMLEILNLDKTEVVSIDTISNQEFTEDECKRLRQSIKFGFINRMTVGDILEKATEVQAARVSDWLESEIVRLSHLRDRASEKGRKKELRECVEKLQLIKTPEERRRRLEEIPEIHADPKMDPSYESEEEDGETEDTKRDIYMRSKGSGFNRKGREPISPQGGSFSSKDSWSGMRSNSSKNLESHRNTSNENYLNKGEESTHIGEIVNESLEKSYSAVISGTVGLNSHSAVRSESLSVVSETSPVPHSTGLAETAEKISETEKMWHYRDPTGKVQGPFSMVQLRKWSNTGFFPTDLRIWRTTDKQDNSFLLTDALDGRFQKEATQVENSYMKAQTVLSPHLSSTNTEKPYGTSLQKMELSSSSSWATPSPEVSKLSTDTWGSDIASRSDSLNLPSPTPKQNAPGSAFGANSFTGGNGSVQSPTVATPDNGQSMRSSTPSYLNNPNGSKEQTALGFQVPTSVSGGQLIRGSEIDASSTHTGVNAAPNFEQGILAGSANALPAFHANVVGESHGVHAHTQHPSQVWASAPTQNVEQPNTSISAPGQPAYGQWGGVPSTVQNPAGNFSTPGFSAMPPPEPWRPPVQGNQPNTQSPAPPSVPWAAMGVAENTNFAPVNPNTGWGPLPVNPNMGWGGPAPGSGNMNWGAIVQAQPPGNANPTWVAPGNPQPTVQGPVNPGWVPPSGNPGAPVQGLPPGNANAGWVMPAGNPGATVQGPPTGNGNSGWGPTTGNPGPTVQGPVSGNANQGWGPSGGNQGMWGNEQQRNGDQFSGRRQWNRQSSFGRGGRGSSRPFSRGLKVPCPYNVNGRRCVKGASCDYLHS